MEAVTAGKEAVPAVRPVERTTAKKCEPFSQNVPVWSPSHVCTCVCGTCGNIKTALKAHGTRTADWLTKVSFHLESPKDLVSNANMHKQDSWIVQWPARYC